MKVIRDSRAELVERLTGDVERDASEMGLTWDELWEASLESLDHHVKRLGPIASNDYSLAFIEGVLVGIHHARST